MEKLRRLHLYLVSYVLIFSLSACRFDVGYDYMYYHLLINKEIKFYEAQFGRLEYLNRFIIEFAQNIDSPQFFFILTSFLIVFLTYRTIMRNSLDPVVSTLVFLSFPIYFLNSLSIIRQYTAVCIVFYAYQFIKQRNLIKYVVAVFIAALFHKTALIALILYWVYGRKFNGIYYVAVFIMGLFFSQIAYFIVELILPQYVSYLDRKLGTGGDKMLLLYQVIGLIMLFMVNRRQTNEKEYNFYLNAFYIGLFIWSSLAPYGHAGVRGGLYFNVFFILLLPEIIHEFKERKLLKNVFVYLSIAIFTFSLWLGTKNPTKDPNIPYRVFFLTDKSKFKNIDIESE